MYSQYGVLYQSNCKILPGSKTHNLCSEGRSNSLSVIALTHGESLLNLNNVYRHIRSLAYLDLH